MGIFRRRARPAPSPAATDLEARFGGFDEYLRRLQTQFSFNSTMYQTGDTVAAAARVATANGPVAALMFVRGLVFSEVRFAFQRYRGGRAGELFGTSALGLLERPWAGATTGDLLSRLDFDASVYGNSYWVEEQGQLCWLDPCNVTVVTGEVLEPLTGVKVGERLVGYTYKEPLAKRGVLYPAEMVCHYKPHASRSQFVGQSWIASVLPDVAADEQMTTYKTALVRNAATPNLVVQFQSGVSPEQFQATRDIIEADHTGATNAFSTLYLGAGVDVKTIGLNFEQLAFKATQGAGETRLAAAAGVPAAIVGFSEGMQGSALNAGNYGASRRRFADGTMRPLWRAAAGALQAVTGVPGPDTRLWYDDVDVSFLQEDVKDAADIKAVDAGTINSLIGAGFDPQSAVDAVRSGDLTLLVHTGLVSVQLQAPGTPTPIPARSVPQEQLALPVAN